MKDYAVVGSGVGGSSIAAYLDAKGFDTVLFEKEPYLGGCSSTFSHQGYRYNSGATTLAGYENGHSVKKMFDTLGITPDLIKTDPGIVSVQKGKQVKRYRDLERFLVELEAAYPHPKNRAFWTLVHEIGNTFYHQNGFYYSNRSLFTKLRSLSSYLPLFLKFKKYLFVNAYDFIHNYFGEISEEYLNFMEAQLMIVAQAKSREINFFTAALSLGYTFNQTHYVKGGFDTLFEQITSKVKDVRKNCLVEKIEKSDNHYTIYTKHEIIKAKKVIMNATVYDSKKYFDAPEIRSFYSKYEKLNNYQSSFMLYMTIKSDALFHHHYQIIEEEAFPHTLSNALFVSFSDPEDNTIVDQGHYSVTASIHTDVRFWEDKKSYKNQKIQLQTLMLKCTCDRLGIEDSQIIHKFSATPQTFGDYINRTQLGGNAITMKNFLYKLPGNDTSIEGLYHVGDSVYPAQGWPGVMMGVENLKKLLHV